jgi:hypothetical protein
MKFKTPDGEPFEISTDLWQRAGMPDFVGSRCCYQTEDTPCTLVPTSDIVPLKREPGIPGFGENGLNDGRLESILQAFRDDIQLPPVQLIELKSGGRYRYKIYHGVHRFYASVAAGFSHLPVKVVPDYQQLVDDEGAKRVWLTPASGAPGEPLTAPTPWLPSVGEPKAARLGQMIRPAR